MARSEGAAPISSLEGTSEFPELDANASFAGAVELNLGYDSLFVLGRDSLIPIASRPATSLKGDLS